MFGKWPLGSLLALVTILSEGALLLVAAQTGFIDGPRVMANMAIDSWLPRRFASLSERLTMQNGVVLMGGAALLLLFYTHGSISALVVMYSINVFLTFSLSKFGMARFAVGTGRPREVEARPDRPSRRLPHVYHHSHHHRLREIQRRRLGHPAHHVGCHRALLPRAASLRDGQAEHPRARRDPHGHTGERAANTAPLDPDEPTAILLAAGFNSFGLHTLLSVVRYFPDLYKNFIFVSVAEIDSGSFKGAAEIQALRDATRACHGKVRESDAPPRVPRGLPDGDGHRRPRRP